mgnify:CR=1 FL=1
MRCAKLLAIRLITVTSKAEVDEGQQESVSIKVQGKVVDENGVPIPGVNVKVHGTKRGAITDLDGRYTIKAKSDDVLNFSFVGYKSEQILVKGKSTLNVSLLPSSTEIDEVTVVA